MKGKVKLKIFTFFLVVAGLKCDFLDEVKELLDKLQSTVDKISLEQIKTNKKVDQLEEKIETLGTIAITVEDLNGVNNNISDAIDQLKNEFKALTLDEHSGNRCNEAETNVADNANENQDKTNSTDDHFDALIHVAKEVEEKGKNIICFCQLHDSLQLHHNSDLFKRYFNTN